MHRGSKALIGVVFIVVAALISFGMNWDTVENMSWFTPSIRPVLSGLRWAAVAGGAYLLASAIWGGTTPEGDSQD